MKLMEDKYFWLNAMVCVPMMFWGWKAFATCVGMVVVWAMIFDPFPERSPDVHAKERDAADR